MSEILRIEGLSKTFTLSRKQQRLERTNQRRKVAVDNLTFTANRGEIFGLLGPNGAGKTTTLRMLATLIKPDSGDAWVDESSIVSQPEEVRGKIAFLTSELKLEDFFTPNYLFNFFSDLHGVDPSTSAARKKALFSRFGIDKFAEVKVANLQRPRRHYCPHRDRLPARAPLRRQDHHPVHPHLQSGGTPLRPSWHHHRRPPLGMRNPRRGMQRPHHRRPIL